MPWAEAGAGGRGGRWRAGGGGKGGVAATAGWLGALRGAGGHAPVGAVWNKTRFPLHGWFLPAFNTSQCCKANLTTNSILIVSLCFRMITRHYHCTQSWVMRMMTMRGARPSQPHGPPDLPASHRRLGEPRSTAHQGQTSTRKSMGSWLMMRTSTRERDVDPGLYIHVTRNRSDSLICSWCNYKMGTSSIKFNRDLDPGLYIMMRTWIQVYVW